VDIEHRRIVLFGCGSTMIVDVEETCARLGCVIAAIVKNVEGPVCALASERVVAADDLDPALTSCEYLVPFFTPAHRLAASRDAASGASRAPRR
jgi:hypothetical protein